MPDSRPTPAVLRRAGAAITLLTVAVLSGCGNEASGPAPAATTSTTPSESAATASATPTGDAGATTSAAPEVHSAEPTDEPPIEFTTAMVRSVEVNKQNKGGQANVNVVADTIDPGALLDVANGCVEHYLSEQKAAFCHVWGTEANYAARDPQGVGNLLCWTHYVGVPLNGGDAMVTTSAPYILEIEGCPDVTG